ncbi:formylglycine-generating enzyme family protein [Hamadaea tsunoensis]|uniref:formylglycine-generating enzyme family protein n=1 Tax=Hamadaea tsunoensis TaxID=53368 RepID=UPI000688BEE3|nr:SUMF1/EgtB/PvdO family nonheme iron enzyme [Hamadaea tsunoensis]
MSTSARSETQTHSGGPAGDWVTVPGGPFTMGADRTRPDGRPRSCSPAHTVDVDTFRIGRRPVSVADFARFVEATSYVTVAEKNGQSYVWTGREKEDLFPGNDALWIQTPGASWRTPRGPGSDVTGKEDHPVTHVSLADCDAYCAWSGTRLCTEAEWEKAARGTDGRTYPWGEEPPTPEHCNYAMNVGDTTPIGAYPAARSPYGLEDITGNVWEWTSTNWHRYPYSEDKSRAIITHGGRVELISIRGGSFFNDCSAMGLSVYSRLYSLPLYTGYDIGFRVCADD